MTKRERQPDSIGPLLSPSPPFRGFPLFNRYGADLLHRQKPTHRKAAILERKAFSTERLKKNANNKYRKFGTISAV
jgi:hypothetical protein